MTRTNADLFTGWLEFDLSSSHGTPIAAVSISIRRDIVLMFIVDRTIAAVDRDRFGTWIRGTTEDFAIDDVVMTQIGGRTYIAIDGGRPFLVDDAIVRQLITHL
jgi:hypothetical protein